MVGSILAAHLMPGTQLSAQGAIPEIGESSRGLLVPPKTPAAPPALDEAAADTLKDVTYATFDVEVTPTTLLTGAAKKST